MEEKRPPAVDINGSMNETDKDRFLIVKAKDGDKNAYGRLVLKYQRRLVRQIFMMMGRMETAEDIVQEAFVKGYLALDSFDINRPFYPWITRIARNLALNRIKRESKMSAFSELDETEIDLPDLSDNPLDSLIDKENDRRLAQAVLALPIPFRIVFVLRMVEEMSYEDIAGKLNISAGTVNSRLSRAREKLVRMLKDLL
ncbi:MAG TPA: sigma-70 family RNA polymerase sigma factor [candidate division Zixibacteria bacterium]|nr:sigma-70 family RNA polymerase sigma factor [candidate division Zixibacteria bacterium]